MDTVNRVEQKRNTWGWLCDDRHKGISRPVLVGRCLEYRSCRLTFDFAPAQRHSRALAELASQTQSSLGPVGSDALSDASLAQIYAIFTIETERDLFRAVMPDRAEAVAAAVFTEPKAEMDDLFFL